MTPPELAVTDPTGPAGAPVLLLGPSLGTASAVLWEDVAPKLAETYRVATWDLPGHGASKPAAEPFTVEDIADALADVAKGFDAPVYAAGVSLGGATTQALAVRHADVVKAAAVICSAPDFAAGADAWTERAATVRTQGTPVLVRPSSERWFAPSTPVARPEIVGRLLHTLSDADDESYAKCCEALAQFDVRDELPGVTIPVLVMYGEEDQATPRDKSEAMAAAIPNAKLVGVASAAHLAPAERPDEVIAELLAFFQGAGA